MSNEASSKAKRIYKQTELRLFYQNDQLVTAASTGGDRHIFRVRDVALVLLDKAQTIKIIKTDQANSVLGVSDKLMVYSPYGHLDTPEGDALLAFNGQWLDPRTLCYLPGSYRLLGPHLQRFCSPDSLSPFASGGLNSYSYCAGDPINNKDPSGHTVESLFRGFLSIKRSPRSKLNHYVSKTDDLINIGNRKLKKLNVAENQLNGTSLRQLKDAINYHKNRAKFDKDLSAREAKVNAAKNDLKQHIESLERNVIKLELAASQLPTTSLKPAHPGQQPLPSYSQATNTNPPSFEAALQHLSDRVSAVRTLTSRSAN